MPVPYTFQENFDNGTSGNWDSETDTESKLNIRHYRQLRASPVREMPYRGAYATYIDLSLGTADAYFEEPIVVGADVTRYVRFYLYAQGLTMAASNRFTIFQLQSAGPVSEVVVDIRNNAGSIEILAAETGAAATVRATSLVQNQWHAIELAANIDAGGGNDGTLDFYVDGYQVGAQITGLDQAAIAQMRLGAMDLDAGTTAGHLLLDEFVVDDARIYPFHRFPTTRHITQTTHVALGPGVIEEVYLRDGGAGNATLELYDTDTADLSANRILHRMEYTSSTRIDERGTSVGSFTRGVYAVLGGTDPEASFTFKHAPMSVGNIRDIAARRL